MEGKEDRPLLSTAEIAESGNFSSVI